MSDSRTQPMTATHTPTPWQWDGGINPPDGPGTYCDIYVDGGDIIIANINDCIPQGAANAAFIVEAVNSHASLKARIQDLTMAMENARYALTKASLTDVERICDAHDVICRGLQPKDRVR